MNLLSIGGSDPSSGAGIQSDIKTFAALNAHPLTIITAITSQNTSKFGIVEPVSKKMLKDQLKMILEDFKIDGIKIGMLYNSEIIKLVHEKLKKLKIPIIVDPVIKSTTNGMLIKQSAIKDFQRCIVPLATIITPNEYEAKILTKSKPSPKNTPEKIAKKIQEMGAKNVVITGIKTRDNQITDLIQEKDTRYFISANKISKINHGSGCIYSAAMTYALAKNKSIRESVKFAKKFTHTSIQNAKKIGKGIVITDIKDSDSINAELSYAINKFTEIKNIYKNIPECQTNFVYSKLKPKTIKDILGVSGRIIKAGDKVILAGNLEYGGSKHVATALLMVNKKFPEIRCAINLKYQQLTVSKIKKLKLIVSSYDRKQEPVSVKGKGSTIQWGIKNAVKKLKTAPDAIYHKGDFGKEPMIILYGNTPENILKKISKINQA